MKCKHRVFVRVHIVSNVTTLEGQDTHSTSSACSRAHSSNATKFGKQINALYLKCVFPCTQSQCYKVWYGKHTHSTLSACSRVHSPNTTKFGRSNARTLSQEGVPAQSPDAKNTGRPRHTSIAIYAINRALWR